MENLTSTPRDFFQKQLGLKEPDADRLMYCISQVRSRIKSYNGCIHKSEDPLFYLKEAQKAIESLTNPQEKEYFLNILYLISDPE